MSSIRKLALATMMLVIAFVAVVASTFAWFTIQQNPQVDEFNVDITSGEGLQISLNNGAAYRLIWETSDFLNIISGSATVTEFQETFRLDTVTPAITRTEEGIVFANAFQKIQYHNPPFPWEVGFDASKNGHYTYTAVEENMKNVGGEWISGKYLRFDILFRAETELDIYVAAAEIKSSNDFAKNSARFGFLPYQNDAGVHTALPEMFRIFNPNVVAGQGFGEGTFFTFNNLRYNFRALYDPSHIDEDVVRLIDAGSGVYQLALPILPEEPEDPITYVYDEDYIDFINSITFDYTSTTPLFTVPQFSTTDSNTIRKLTVYIWLEGWDGQALDQAKGANLDVFLRFTGYQPGALPITP